jgi:hypothetical protein
MWWLIAIVVIVVAGLCWFGCKKGCKPKGQ